MSGYQYRDTFASPYEFCGAILCREFLGKPFAVKGVIETPSEEYDEDALPMFEVEIDGITFNAWPEEVLVS